MRKLIVAWLIGLVAFIALCLAFSGACAALPTSYTGRVKLIAPTITGTHTDMPVLVTVDPQDLRGVGANGEDVRVFNSAGTMLDHEIATWGYDTAQIWFKAPTLATGSIFYVYYSNTDSGAVGVKDLWVDYGANLARASKPRGPRAAGVSVDPIPASIRQGA